MNYKDKLDEIEKLCEAVKDSSMYKPFTYPKIIVDDILEIIKKEEWNYGIIKHG